MRMHALVLGAGVVGVTTAYYLAEAGCDVTVIDRAAEVAAGASHANGGQLSYSFTDSLAKPAFVAKIPGLVFGHDRAARVRLSTDLVRWGLKFLPECSRSRSTANTLALLEMAMRSARLLEALRERHAIDFAHRAAGKLVLLPTETDVREAQRNTLLKRRHGSDVELLTPDEVRELEPALDGLRDAFAGAVYSRSDEVADARAFAEGLRRALTETGRVRFRLGGTVERVEQNGSGRIGVVVDDEAVPADAVVVCLGVWSRRLLDGAGVAAPIYPVRGYSLTLPPGEAAPNISVTSLRHRIVFSRINGFLRIAGFADFAGFDTSRDAERIATLIDVARRAAPAMADYDAADPGAWGGFRPMTPNGRPLIGATRVPGLFVNTGHGMLGWTLACASAYDAAMAVTGSA